MYIAKKKPYLHGSFLHINRGRYKRRSRGLTLQVVNEHETERVTGDGGFAGIIDVMETGPLLNVQN